MVNGTLPHVSIRSAAFTRCGQRIDISMRKFLFHFVLNANCGFPALRRLEAIGGKAGLAAFLKQQRWENLY